MTQAATAYALCGTGRLTDTQCKVAASIGRSALCLCFTHTCALLCAAVSSTVA